jgi:hypothetical protein
MKKRLIAPLLAAVLVLSLGFPAFADTIHLKDGSVIHGQVIGFSDQQFTVLIGGGARGRRSRVTLYMEDVESIEFDSATTAAAAALANEDTSQPTGNTSAPISQSPRNNPPPVQTSRNNPPPVSNTSNRQPATRNTSSPTFFQINTRVRGDNASNGWTNTGLVVRRGQRVRVTATGRVILGNGRSAATSTPAGISTLADRDKLMRNEATGGLIAVIGDDNDDFIFIGASREFIAQRDGVLFLGVNEGNLNDNSGAYDAVIEAEAVR